MNDRYTKLRASAWVDDEVMELPMAGKALWAYIIGGPQCNAAGFYKLPIRVLKTDLCGYTRDGDILPGEEEQFKNVILPLLYGQTKLWKYDKDTSQILIPKYLKHNKAIGCNSLKGLNAQIETLTKCPLHVCFLANVAKYSGKDALMYFNREILIYVKEKAKDMKDPLAVYIYNMLPNLSSL